MNKAETLRRAAEAVVDRDGTYGPVEENFQRIADFWGLWLHHRQAHDGVEPGPTDVAAMNILQKLCRLIETPGHEDSIVDIAGFAACYAECAPPQPEPKGDSE